MEGRGQSAGRWDAARAGAGEKGGARQGVPRIVSRAVPVAKNWLGGRTHSERRKEGEEQNTGGARVHLEGQRRVQVPRKLYAQCAHRQRGLE